MRQNLFAYAAGGALLLPALAVCLAGSAQAQLKVAAEAPREAPYSLTSADGTGLKLVELDARAVVDGPLAFTELRLVFENPEPRQIEGHFKVTMPDGAAMSRFAMEINGAWMEGEVVEKQAARRAYEDALHRRQDPALLEQDSGNTFAARVFPIPANGRKSLIISWSHELTQAGEAYRLPLLGLPRVDRLSLTAMTSAGVGGGPQSSLGGNTSRYQVTKVEKQAFAPTEDWVVFGGELPKEGDALRSGNLAVVRFAVPGAETKEDLKSAVLMFDTSASRAIHFEARLNALAALIAKLPELGINQVEVIAFDQSAKSVFTGAPSAFGKDALSALRGRGALGASSLSAALASLEATKGDGRRVIFLTDGMITAGETDRGKLSTRIAGLASRGVVRVDAIVDTTARDSLVLETLVQSKLPRPGIIVEGREPLAAQLSRLGRKTLDDLQFSVNGAQWLWPESARGLQGGDTVVVFAELPDNQPLALRVSGGANLNVAPKPREAERPLLERAWVRARMERLLSLESKGDPDLAGAFRQQILTLSTKHRVLSPYTAMVVLETEYDYQRMGIDRTALSDILVVGATGVELMRRAAPVMIAQVPPPPPPKPMLPRERRVFDSTTLGGKGQSPGATGGAAPAMAKSKAAKADFDDEGLRDSFDGGGAPAAAPAPAMEMATRTAEPERDEAKQEEGSMGRRGGGEAQLAAPTAGLVDARHPDPFPAQARLAVPPPPPPPTQIAVSETGEDQGRRELKDIEAGAPAITGPMAEVVALIEKGDRQGALGKSVAWRVSDPTDLVALIALGRSLAALGNHETASRAFGSVLDLYPSRADMRRLAGNWLELLGDAGLPLAADTYAQAAEQRPDHPSIYHQQAWVLARQGRYADALDVALKGITAKRATERFAAVERILQEDAQIIAAAWAAASPTDRPAIEAKLAPFGLRIDDRATLRFVLTWETDANDVDFHIFDGRFNHAFYSRKALATGGELYADITTGYGPECFTIYDPSAYPYRLKAHYYRRGPMGYGAGKVQLIRHDGKGRLGFEERPFIIMQDGAFVDLGTVNANSAPIKAIPKLAR